MKKRILGWILSISLIVTAFPVFAYAAEPGDMVLSSSGLEMIKGFEGFISMPMADGDQWCIGYGTQCNPGDYPNGISQEEAERLLLESITYFEDSLNRYLNAYEIVLTQTQFDALVSITYNLGVAWIQSSYRFWSMLRDGLENYTDNEIASAIGVWCHVGTTIHPTVLDRRIAEIRLFLYGDYSGTSSTDFRYLIFDGNGGEVDTDIMLYRENEPYASFPDVQRSGYYFAGWYTQPEGGTPLTAQDIAVEDGTVYAHWSTTPVEIVPPGDGGTELPGDTTTEPVEGAFSDVEPEDWFAQYVTELANAGTVSGYSDNTYRPDATVTVGECLKLIMLSAGYSEQAPTGEHWASGYGTLAVSENLITQEDAADLNAAADRVLVASITAKALGLQPAITSGEFADTDDGYAVALYFAGIMEGSVDSATGERLFHPDQPVKRSEIAKIVWTIQNR